MKNILFVILAMFSVMAFAGDNNGPRSDGNQAQLQGQQQGQLQGQQQGQTSENTNVAGAAAGAISGSASGSISESTSGSESNNQNNSTASTGNSSSDNSGGNSDVYVGGDDATASSAAVLFTQACQQGASGQNNNGGFSIVTQDALCEELKLAEFMRVQAKLAVEDGNAELATEYTMAYHAAVQNANELIRSTREMAFANRVGGQLVIPAALLAILIVIL
jgi:hypothetical protein